MKKSDLFICFLILTAIFLWHLNQRYRWWTDFPRHYTCTSKILDNDPNYFIEFNNGVRLGKDTNIIPNLVHVIRLQNDTELDLDWTTVITAALRTQADSTVMIHTDFDLPDSIWSEFSQEFWSRIKVVRRYPARHVFGRPFRSLDQLHYVTALRVLRKYGGIYVSNRARLQTDLSEFLRYECVMLTYHSVTSTLHYIDSNVLVAHKNARLLQRWLNQLHDPSMDLQPLTLPSYELFLCKPLSNKGVYVNVTKYNTEVQ